MKKHTITLEEYELLQEENLGMCIACGYQQGAVEPDAENYECEDCGENKVMGVDNLLIMGYVV